MSFSWTDQNQIYPVWSSSHKAFPTIALPSTQKNKKCQEVPMLPALQDLLNEIPADQRNGWVVNPLPIDYQVRANPKWFQPTPNDLVRLARQYNNSAIARACGVTETTVRNWITKADIVRTTDSRQLLSNISAKHVAQVRRHAQRILTYPARRSTRRLTKERVGRVISMIGEKAGIIVEPADDEAGQRVKFASAHDLRRGCALRLINAGISAETLKLVLRHKNFSTTERFYGATRAAQSAAREINEKLATGRTKSELVGGLVGGIEEAPQLSTEELRKLKALLNSP